MRDESFDKLKPLVDLRDHKRSPAEDAQARWHQRSQNVLRESQTHDAKECVIKKAATTGKTTFTTAVFGRGADFLCNDPKVHDAGWSRSWKVAGRQ